jgi:hypothetical protein
MLNEKDEAIFGFAISVITKQLQDISGVLKGLEERLERMEATSNENYEDLVERISNISTPGDDFSIERY